MKNIGFHGLHVRVWEIFNLYCWDQVCVYRVLFGGKLDLF